MQALSGESESIPQLFWGNVFVGSGSNVDEMLATMLEEAGMLRASNGEGLRSSLDVVTGMTKRLENSVSEATTPLEWEKEQWEEERQRTQREMDAEREEWEMLKLEQIHELEERHRQLEEQKDLLEKQQQEFAAHKQLQEEEIATSKQQDTAKSRERQASLTSEPEKLIELYSLEVEPLVGVGV